MLLPSFQIASTCFLFIGAAGKLKAKQAKKREWPQVTLCQASVGLRSYCLLTLFSSPALWLAFLPPTTTGYMDFIHVSKYLWWYVFGISAQVCAKDTTHWQMNNSPSLKTINTFNCHEDWCWSTNLFQKKKSQIIIEGPKLLLKSWKRASVPPVLGWALLYERQWVKYLTGDFFSRIWCIFSLPFSSCDCVHHPMSFFLSSMNFYPKRCHIFFSVWIFCLLLEMLGISQTFMEEKKVTLVKATWICKTGGNVAE